jgi:methylase of polypeptide subunit release factors
MTFTKEQYDLVKKQLQAHQRESGIKSLVLDENTHTSLDLLIERGVFGSDIITTAVHFARFLYEHQELYSGKDVADIGCGPGTQGLVMSKYGAKSVVFVDINPKAVANTQKNIQQHKLANAEVYQSDLFSGLPQNISYDVVLFNHPFFSEEPEKFEGDPNQDEMLRRSMLGGTELLQRFFREVPQYLKQDGIIIMPYFHFAGKENDPATHVEKYKLKVSQEHKVESKQGLHLGDVSIYVLSRDGGNPQ